MIKKIHLWDLPEDLVYLDLEKNLKDKLFSSAKKYTGTWVNLGKALGLKISDRGKCKALECVKEGKKFKLKLLKKLVDFLSKYQDVDKNKIERNVLVLATKCRGKSKNKLANCIINPKLPFEFNNIDTATIISALLCDGGIDSRFHPHYRNEEVILRKRIYEAFVDVFGKFDGQCNDFLKKEQIYFPKVVGIILVKVLGLGYGRKTDYNPSIPLFIMDSSKNIKATFLQQAFDDEGSVHFNNRSIEFKLANFLPKNINLKEIEKSNLKYNLNFAPNLIKDLIFLLCKFNIKTTKLRCCEVYQTKAGRFGTKWRFEITKRRNLIEFHNKINFFLPRKKEKLKEIIKLPYHESYPRNKSEKIIYYKCIELQKKQGYITSRSLANEVKRTQYRTKQVICSLVKKGLLIVESHRQGKKGARYITSNVSQKY